MISLCDRYQFFASPVHRLLRLRRLGCYGVIQLVTLIGLSGEGLGHSFPNRICQGTTPSIRCDRVCSVDCSVVAPSGEWQHAPRLARLDVIQAKASRSWNWTKFVGRLTPVVGGVVLVAIVSGWITAYWITRPLRRLNAAADQIARGEFEHPIAIEGIGLVRQLAESLHHMAVLLNASFQSTEESERQLWTLLDSLPVGVLVLNAQGRVMLINQVGQDILGYPPIGTLPHDHIAEICRIFQAGTDKLYPVARLPNILALQGQPVCCDDLEIEVRGIRVPLEVKTLPVMDDNGQVLYIINAFQDISERRKAEKFQANYQRELESQVSERTHALQASEARWRSLVQNAPSFILTLTRTGNITYINRPAPGITLDEMLGKTFHDFTSLEYYEIHQAALEQVFAEGKTLTYELPSFDTHPHEENRWYSISLGPIWQDEEIVAALGVINDISDRKRAEEDLRHARDAADAANRAKSEFLANMSHELRTPLNAILGFAQLMSRDHNITPIQQDYLETILRSGDHLLGLINSVLNLSKIEAGRMVLEEAHLDLPELLRSLQMMFQSRANLTHNQIIIDIAEDVPTHIIVDQNKLRQILINLIGNALKFTRQGTITVRVNVFASYPFTSEESKEPAKRWLKFEVEDTGIGIPSQDQERIFDAFFQTEHGQGSTDGTGLGLAICRKLLDMMGGQISVSSVLGEGSIFHVCIPVRTSSSPEDNHHPAYNQVVGLANQTQYRILVVDDQAENRQFLVSVLLAMGFEVQEAVSGETAIALWNAWHPHLILLDLRMPELDGYTTSHYIREQEAQSEEPRSKIIALTASAFDEDRSQAIAAGCDDFLSKPLDLADLFSLLAQHLGVTYTYANQQHLETAQPAPEHPLTPDMLLTLPLHWKTAVYDAAIRCDDSTVLHLIQQLPTQYAPVVQGLTYLSENFLFEDIIQLVAPHNVPPSS